MRRHPRCMKLEEPIPCHQAERAISRTLDGRLPRAHRRRIQAHLDVCPDCVAFERLQRANRAVLRSFASAPVPETLRVSGQSSLAVWISERLAAGPGPIVSDRWES